MRHDLIEMKKEKKGTRRTRCEMPHLGIELTSRHIPFYGVCWMLYIYMKGIGNWHGIASRLARLTVPKKKKIKPSLCGRGKEGDYTTPIEHVISFLIFIQKCNR
jgi:hypothetical protein